MEQPILRNRSKAKSNQEKIAHYNVREAKEHSISQVVREMETLRKKAKEITDNSTMNQLNENLITVAMEGIKNIAKHISVENVLKDNRMQAAAQKMDALLYEVLGKRFVDGKEEVCISFARDIGRSIMATIDLGIDIAKDMGKTLTSFLTAMLEGMMKFNSETWKLFKGYYNMPTEIRKAMNDGLRNFDRLVQDIPGNTPADITKEHREELERTINLIEIDYAACFNGMGLKVFLNSMLTFCVSSVSAATSLVIAATSGELKNIEEDYAKYFKGLGIHLFANSMMYMCATSVTSLIIAAGPWVTYMSWIAVSCILLYLATYGYNNFFGTDGQPDKNIKRWQRYID